MRILVTGGNGLVGRNIREKLEMRHETLAPSHTELDLLKTDDVIAYMRDRKPDIVVHCAGIVGGIQANMREPVRFLVENFEIGKNVVLAAAEAGVSRLINLGSSCMYPRTAQNPLREEYILEGELEPTNEGYAIAKIAVQRLCSYMIRERPNLAYKTIIPCNLYGRWDKFDTKYSHMIPAVIRKLHNAKLGRLDVVDIWGTGRARREFMYAGDLADFIIFSFDRFSDLPDTLNIGLGYDYTIDEYYTAVAEVVGYYGTFRHDETKPEGMERKLVDITALGSFGWKAKTSLIDGIRLTYDFFLKQEN